MEKRALFNYWGSCASPRLPVCSINQDINTNPPETTDPSIKLPIYPMRTKDNSFPKRTNEPNTNKLNGLQTATSPSLYPLPTPLPRQAAPTSPHPNKQPHTNRMQHPRAPALSHDPRHKGRHGPTRAAHGADDAQRTDLHACAAAVSPAARQVPGEDRGGAGIDRAEEDADDGDEEGVAEGVELGHQPNQELRGEGAEGEEGDGELFAEEVTWVR